MVFNRKILCVGLMILFGVSVFAGISSNVHACYWYRISCEGASYQDYDGGGQDVEYHSITVKNVDFNAGESHKYSILFEYSPGCGAKYSAKYWIKSDSVIPSGWTVKLEGSTGSNINGVQLPDYRSSGDDTVYLTVTSPSSAPSGESAKVTMRLWTNDTGACNEHNTLDMFTVTNVAGGGGPQPLKLSVSAPNGGEDWSVGTQHDITWTASGGNGTVTIKLEYSSTGSSGAWIVVSPSETNDGKFTWTIPSTPSADCYVQASATDASSPPVTITDISDKAFTISQTVAKPTITLSKPNGGEVWQVSTQQSITWSASGGTGTLSVCFEYSTTGSSGSWTVIALQEANDGTYTWTIPDKPSTNCFVKAYVSDSGTPPQTATDYSDSAFTIEKITTPPPSITVTAPKGGEIWTVSSLQSITWTASGGTGTLTIKLEYSTTGNTGPWTTIATGETNDGLYTWNVPNAPSTNCFVQATVTDTAPSPKSSSDQSNSAFTIASQSAPPVITVSSPFGGEKWTIGTQHDITWSAGGGTGTLTIKLEYSTAGSTGPWTQISNGEANDGYYTWTIPNTPSTTCYLIATVTDSSTPVKTASDTKGPFIITSQSMPSVSLISPNGGEMWTINTPHDITWKITGGTGAITIKLQYSVLGSAGPWTDIVDNDPNDGVYSWNVPDTPATNCYVLIVATDSASPPEKTFDIGDAAFTITTISLPSITVTQPNGGETWEVYSAQTIKWIASGGTGILKISLKYSINGINGPWTLIANDEDNDGAYNWMEIPNTPSTICYVLVIVTDSASPPQSVADMGNAMFSITTTSNGKIVGLVRNSGNTALPFATVNVFKNNVWLMKTSSDKEGYYNLSLAAGEYELNATKTGYYASARAPVTVIAGYKTQQDLVLGIIPQDPKKDNNQEETIAGMPAPMFFGLMIGVIVLVMIPILVAALFMKRKKQQKPPEWSTYQSSPQTPYYQQPPPYQGPQPPSQPPPI